MAPARGSSGNQILNIIVVAVLAVAILGGAVYFVLPYVRSPSQATSDPAAPVVEARPDLGAWGREELLRMASRVALAEVTEKTIMPPPLELERERSARSAEGEGVRIVTGFECSVPLEINKLSDSHFSLRITTEGQRNWFMFRVEGIPAEGRIVRIDLESVNLGKWHSLNPVYSYCTSLDDLSAFEATEGKADPVAAFNGPLLPDTSGQQWHYIPDVWTEGKTRLSFVHHFEHNGYVAMRVPYTPSLNERLMASLEGNPYAQVFTIGHTPQGRPLQILKVGGSEEDDKTRPCVLIYGREHASEHDTSWVVEGAARYLLSDDQEAMSLRKRVTFLLIPVFDPDGAAMSLYEHRSGMFRVRNAPPEVLSYATWFERWVDAGKRLDVAISLHNVESGEGEHLFCVFTDPGRHDPCQQLHRVVLQQFEDDQTYKARSRAGTGYVTTQLAGYLGYYFGPLPLLYEANSQEKGRHLTLAETRDLGRRLTRACGLYLSSDSARQTLTDIDYLRAGRTERLVSASPELNPIERATQLKWTTILAAREWAGVEE